MACVTSASRAGGGRQSCREEHCCRLPRSSCHRRSWPAPPRAAGHLQPRRPPAAAPLQGRRVLSGAQAGCAGNAVRAAACHHRWLPQRMRCVHVAHGKRRREGKTARTRASSPGAAGRVPPCILALRALVGCPPFYQGVPLPAGGPPSVFCAAEPRLSSPAAPH